MGDSFDVMADFQSAKSKMDMYVQTMNKIISQGVQLGEIMNDSKTSTENVTRLLDDLESLASPRAFCCGGWVQLSNRDANARLKMKEDETNQLGWPITSLPVDNLLEFCMPAQYGDLKLQQTVYNPKVRLASECEASKFLFTKKPREPKTGKKRRRDQSCQGFVAYRPLFLETIGEKVSSNLSNGDEVSLECNKLNVYGKGGFFNAHVDTPVDPTGMIGTVVVCLPCQHKGGVLTVKHHGVKEKFKFADLSGDQGKIQWAAFYSDCIHEILPVSDGNRITITYNIIRQNTASAKSMGPGNKLCKSESISSHSVATAENKERTDDIISDIVRIATDDDLQHFGIFLQHKYTMSALAAGNLKGCDQILYDGLSSKGLTCHLLTVLVHEVELMEDEYGQFDWECEDIEHKTVYAFSQEDMDYVNEKGLKPHPSYWKDIQFVDVWSTGRLLVEETEKQPENCGNSSEPGEYERLYLQSAVIIDIPDRLDKKVKVEGEVVD